MFNMFGGFFDDYSVNEKPICLAITAGKKVNFDETKQSATKACVNVSNVNDSEKLILRIGANGANKNCKLYLKDSLITEGVEYEEHRRNPVVYINVPLKNQKEENINIEIVCPSFWNFGLTSFSPIISNIALMNERLTAGNDERTFEVNVQSLMKKFMMLSAVPDEPLHWSKVELLYPISPVSKSDANKFENSDKTVNLKSTDDTDILKQFMDAFDGVIGNDISTELDEIQDEDKSEEAESESEVEKNKESEKLPSAADMDYPNSNKMNKNGNLQFFEVSVIQNMVSSNDNRKTRFHVSCNANFNLLFADDMWLNEMEDELPCKSSDIFDDECIKEFDANIDQYFVLKNMEENQEINCVFKTQEMVVEADISDSKKNENEAEFQEDVVPTVNDDQIQSENADNEEIQSKNDGKDAMKFGKDSEIQNDAVLSANENQMQDEYDDEIQSLVNQFFSEVAEDNLVIANVDKNTASTVDNENVSSLMMDNNNVHQSSVVDLVSESSSSEWMPNLGQNDFVTEVLAVGVGVMLILLFVAILKCIRNLLKKRRQKILRQMNHDLETDAFSMNYRALSLPSDEATPV